MRRAVFALALLGCGGAPPVPAAPIAVTPAMYDATAMTLTDVAAGAPIDLVRPPQGGFVLFVGARVKNLGDPNVELRARLLDPAAGGALVDEDARVVTFLPDPADATGWLPDLRSYQNVSNVTVCPSAGAADRFDQPLSLQVVVTELATGRSGTATLATVPSCRQTDPQLLALCRCDCAGNWTPTKCGAPP